MAQQRLQFAQNTSGGYTVTQAADVTNIGTDDFWLIVDDDIGQEDLNDKLRQLIHAIEDGQDLRAAIQT